MKNHFTGFLHKKKLGNIALDTSGKVSSPAGDRPQSPRSLGPQRCHYTDYATVAPYFTDTAGNAIS